MNTSALRLASVLFALSCTLPAGTALAQASAYPAKPVRLITGFAAGGPTDLMARVLGEKLQAAWKQSVIVEARPGASGILGMEQVKNAAPDGHLLLVAPTNTMGVNPHLFPKLSYDPLKDFTLIARVANIDNVLVVNASVPIKTMNDLAGLARAYPGTLTFGSPANGSQAHLAGEFLNQYFKVQMTHVPYKGMAPAINDLLGGQITMAFATVSTVLQHVRSGKLRAVALPSRERNASMPEVPTFAEQGIGGFEAVTWFLLIGPANMPPEVTAKIRAGTLAALREPDTRERYRGFGADLPASPNEDLEAFLRRELTRWGEVVRTAGIKAN
jgi:tripartite-type tricarboxylate transporter receptor subunit TctC